jgi:hypothetical protein
VALRREPWPYDLPWPPWLAWPPLRPAPDARSRSWAKFPPMAQPDAWCMIRRRAAAAGIAAPIGCHTFRATGSHRLPNGGALEQENGGARESAHDQALRSHEGAAYAGRSGEDQAVRPELCYRTSKGAARRRRKRVDPTVASYALRGDGLIFTTFDGGLGLSRRNASATLSARRARRYGFWRTRSPSAGENAAMSA